MAKVDLKVRVAFYSDNKPVLQEYTALEKASLWSRQEFKASILTVATNVKA